MGTPFTEYQHIVPLLGPIDKAATAAATPYIDLKTAHNLAFYAFFGSITAASADESITITVEASSAGSSNSSEAAIAFSYRLSSAVNTDSWGDITAATSSGMSVATTDDSKMVEIWVDPAVVANAVTNKNGRYVRMVITPHAEGTATLVAAWAMFDPRYKMASMLSSSAA